MSKLRSRIVSQAGNSRAAQQGNHPAGNADTPMVMPMVHVYRGQQVTAVEQVVPTAPASTPSGAVGAPGLEQGTYGHAIKAGQP